MKPLVTAGAITLAALACSAALAQCPCPASAPYAYAPPAFPIYAPGGDLYYTPNAYDNAQNAAARVRDREYRTYRREDQWRALKADWPAIDYDLMYGPGAYAQNYELPKHPIW